MGDFEGFDLNDLVPDTAEQAVYDKQYPKEGYYELKNDNIEPWLFNGQPIDEIPAGHDTFVYLFTNKITGKQYIGYKTATSNVTKVVAGKKRRTKKDSDWRVYYSSSQDVLHDVGYYGRGNFVREILAFTVNKSIGKYLEAYYQFTKNVLTTDKDRYYNGIVNLRINQAGLSKIDKVVYCNKVIGDQIYFDKLNERRAAQPKRRRSAS